MIYSRYVHCILQPVDLYNGKCEFCASALLTSSSYIPKPYNTLNLLQQDVHGYTELEVEEDREYCEIIGEEPVRFVIIMIN